MSRLAPLDKALVLILVPIWVVCFALGVKTQVDGGGIVLLGLSVEDAESYPALTGEFGLAYPSSPFEKAGLRAGDLLVRVGEADLRGVGTLDLIGYAREASGRDPSVPVVYERDGERHETSLAVSPVSTFRPLLAISFSFAASALFLLFRAKPTPMVRAYFHGGFCIALFGCYFVGSRLEIYAWSLLWVVSTSLLFPLLLRFLSLFPDDRAPEGRWNRIWPWCFAAPGPFLAIALAGRITIGEAGAIGSTALAAAALLAVATGKYRRADAVARRQIKWFLFGVYCALLPMVVASVVVAFEPRFGWLWLLSCWAVPLLPILLLVSVARFNLFDIDRLLSATASYNILLVLLVGAGLVLVPRVAEATSELLRVDPVAGQIVISLLLAATVIPAQRRFRPKIDRLFFRERYALDQGIEELLRVLSTCEGPEALTQVTGERLHKLLRPEACVIYAGGEQGYAPVFVEGRAVPPAFESASPLIGTLRRRRQSLVLDGAGRRLDNAPLGPFDRAALETLGAAVVIPVLRGEALLAFLCLGPKRSGDVYTSTDLSLLSAVGETVSRELRRFDQDEVVRQGRAMQESLRRYVPGVIAEQLSAGVELASGEREVSVLFVDIRGYTSFSESRKSEEIFSTVNRYTETVSQIVQKHAGSVVEFNGDGMMTVFGAPRDLAHKERAAVEAGREIVEAVAALTVNDAEGAPTNLSVGVGIATGEAFVGNIQAVDRMIWTAIGNTTNLAARLQSLTRDLDAALVIDNRTWEGAQPTAAVFEKRPDVSIRGRRQTQDVYVLPLPRAAGRSPA